MQYVSCVTNFNLISDSSNLRRKCEKATWTGFEDNDELMRVTDRIILSIVLWKNNRFLMKTCIKLYFLIQAI